MIDSIMVAKWKISGVKRILQALQTTELDNAVNDDVCFVLVEELENVIKTLDTLEKEYLISNNLSESPNITKE